MRLRSPGWPGDKEGDGRRARLLGPPGQNAASNDSTERPWLDLQRLAGNAAVLSLLVVQRKPRRPKSSTEYKAEFVSDQVDRGRFKELSTPMSEGSAGPPTPGGAFWMLNGLNPPEMHEVLRLIGKPRRAQLLAHITDADGLFDRPRLESALRSTSWGQRSAGTAGLEVMDAIRNAGIGSFVGVWSLLAGKSRVKVIATLRTLPRDLLTGLRARLGDAPASDQDKLREVIADLLGTGTDMQASDVIDVEGLRGLELEMASIYNIRGQLIAEQARDLGIPTDAAAGIMKVESGGATFSGVTDKTIVRFENHVFWPEWGRHHRTEFNDHFDFDRTRGGKPFHGHRFREDPAAPWDTCHQDQPQEWHIMEFAAGLSGKELAYRSASWGAGQIMGSNAAMVGYASAVDMADAFNRAERPQVIGIFEYIRVNGLATAINRGDYLTVARGYNGAGQAATYERLITDAATAYQRVTAGHRHVIP